jgi:hypothetical protein
MRYELRKARASPGGQLLWLEFLPQFSTRLRPLVKLRFDRRGWRRRWRRFRQNALERRDRHGDSPLSQFQRANRHSGQEAGNLSKRHGNLFGEEAARLWLQEARAA